MVEEGGMVALAARGCASGLELAWTRRISSLLIRSVMFLFWRCIHLRSSLSSAAERSCSVRSEKSRHERRFCQKR